jgi:hypothetical protein
VDELRDLHLLNFWRHPPGAVGRVVGGVVVFAAALTIAIAAVGARVLWSYYDCLTELSRFWFRNGLAMLVSVVVVLSALPPWQLSRCLRVAVVLPVAHAFVMAVAWWYWAWEIGAPRNMYRASVLIEKVPIGATVAIVGLVMLGRAWLITWRRRGELVHGLVMLALADLLLLGLWLPIASAVWGRNTLWNVIDWARPGSLIALVIVPPLVVATAFTWLAVRRPGGLPRIRVYVAVGLAILFVLAMGTRITRIENRYVVFGNFVHVLLAVAFVAVMSLVVLGVRTWLRGRHAARVLSGAVALTGVVAKDDEGSDVVARVEITSWLRGPRALVRPFLVTTRVGDVPIAGGAWVGPLSVTTTQLRAGESVSTLRRGDRVVIAGLVDGRGAREDAHPFRSAPAPTAGAGGIWVGHASTERYGLANVALTLWRPCVAYLAILIAIGLPSLVAALVAD